MAVLMWRNVYCVMWNVQKAVTDGFRIGQLICDPSQNKKTALYNAVFFCLHESSRPHHLNAPRLEVRGTAEVLKVVLWLYNTDLFKTGLLEKCLGLLGINKMETKCTIGTSISVILLLAQIKLASLFFTGSG